MKFFFQILPAVFLFSSFTSDLHAHQEHQHADSETTAPATSEYTLEKIQKIGDAYLKNVEPIFRQKCFDCHSSHTRYPKYYSIPGIKQLIDSDIREGMKHLDMTPGYPFRSHATPREDLDALEEVAQKNTMPPFRYRLMHRGSTLTEVEKKSILQWVQESRQELKGMPQTGN